MHRYPDQMSVAQINVLERLLEGPAWTTVDDLVDRLGYHAVEKAKLISRGRGVEAVTEACAGLAAAGWLSVQARDGGTTVTLAPRGADQLGVQLCLRRKVPRWKRVVDRPFRTRLSFVPADELERVETQPREWYSDEPEVPINEPYFRAGRHWIWPWRRTECETGCHAHPLAQGDHCLCCGRPSWEPPE